MDKSLSELVGGLEHFLFLHILGIIIPTDELIFFRGVGQPPSTTNSHIFQGSQGSLCLPWTIPSIHWVAKIDGTP
jgi:hypothetical protein